MFATLNEASEAVNARAYPVGDAQGPRLIHAENEQGLPSHGWARLKKLVRWRVATLNVGTMSGRGREVADMMGRRKIDVLCVQETRWKGNKAKELGDGCKLLYSGANREGRNGVGIVVSKHLRDSILGVRRKNDRIMSVKLGIGELVVNIVCAYAPQVGSEEGEKATFWDLLEQELSMIPDEERLVLGGDLNGHVGRGEEVIRRIHGGWGMGIRDEDGERIIDCALSFDLAVLNTFFQKREDQYVTYRSGNRESQIDFLMCRRQQLKEMRNCKVIKGEAVSSQHRVVVMDWEVGYNQAAREVQMAPKIKWWRLKDVEIGQEFKGRVLREIGREEDVQVWWRENSQIIRRIGEQVLGKTSGRKPPGDKETWWWNNEVKMAIGAKKEAKKRWDGSRSLENKERYKQANKRAKKEVARAKARAMEEAYDEIETERGENKILKIARARDRATKDFTQVKQIKDEQGLVLSDPDKVKDRWKEYFERLLNEENPRVILEDGIASCNMTENIRREEVEVAIRKMKNGKAVGPDEIPVEVWKCLGEEGVDMVWELIVKIFEQEKMPEEWRESVLIPIFKEKGDVQDCGNYRGIKLMSHTMKIWERIMDRRLRAETSIGEEQFGFMPGRGTTDAVFALRQVMERYREKDKGLHLVFIDLEKAYDRVPRQEVWRCMREKRVPEKYVRIIQDMYEGSKTRVRSSVGLTEWFTVGVGLHQGSAVSPYLFDLVMDVVTSGIRDRPPWCMLYADDIVLCGESKEEVENKLEQWRRALEDRGLRISRKKTEYLQFNEDQEMEMVMQGERLKRVDKFGYLGSVVAKDGELDAEIAHRVQAGWRNWRKVSGVLCDRKINPKKKGKVYETVVRPAMLYGAEAWPIKKVQERKLEVTEMRMLRWMCGVTRKDRIRNDRIRGTTGVVKISRKMQDRRLQWYGHVMRRGEDEVGRRVMGMEVAGRRPRGRPRRRWRDCVREDLEDRHMIDVDVNDRVQWRGAIRNVDPT